MTRARAGYITFFLLLTLPLEAGQGPHFWQLGLDLGVARLKLSDRVLNDFQYEGWVPSLINLAAARHGQKYVLNLETRVHTGTLDQRFLLPGMFNEHRIQFFELSTIYYRSLHGKSSVKKLQGFVGLGSNASFGYSELRFGNLQGFSRSQSSFTTSLINLSFAPRVRYEMNGHHLQLDATFSFLTIGQRPDNLQRVVPDSPLNMLDTYIDFQWTLSDQIDVGKHIFLRLAYRLRFIKHNAPFEMKQLVQTFQLGLYIRLP